MLEIGDFGLFFSVFCRKLVNFSEKWWGKPRAEAKAAQSRGQTTEDGRREKDERQWMMEERRRDFGERIRLIPSNVAGSEIC